MGSPPDNRHAERATAAEDAGMWPEARRASLSWPQESPQVDLTPVAERIRDAQVRAMHEVMVLAQLASIGCGLAVAFILWHRIGHPSLLLWLSTRVLISSTRIW